MASKKETLELRELDLKCQKLEAEVRKETAAADNYEQENRNTAASSDRAHVYYFTDDVGVVSVAKCIERLDRWSRREPGCEIKLVLNSPGGGIISGFALYDFLQELKGKGHYLTTIARGYAASMGGILLQAGDTRLIGPSAFMLIHEPSSGAIGRLTDIEDSLHFSKMLGARCLDILAERSTLDAKQIKRKWERTDWWLDANDAYNLGFVDGIEA